MDKTKRRIIAEEQQFKHAKRDLERIVTIFDQVGFSEFVMYLKSPRRIILWNFVAGMFRGLGIVVGMTIVVAGLVWVMSKMVDFPLIGEYFQKVLEILQDAVPKHAG